MYTYEEILVQALTMIGELNKYVQGKPRVTFSVKMGSTSNGGYVLWASLVKWDGNKIEYSAMQHRPEAARLIKEFEAEVAYHTRRNING